MRLLLLLFCLPFVSRGAPPSVLTYHNDNNRSGWNAAETALTWTSVRPSGFGKLFVLPVDGAVFAQPLYVSGLSINGSRHNVVFVATENNSVYALDADSNTGLSANPLWHANFNHGPAGVTVTPMPAADVSCPDIAPIVGITGTPVVSLANGALYVVAKTREVSSSGTQYVQRLHALDLLTGQEKFGGPAVIKPVVAGSCGLADGRGHVAFNSRFQNQRAGLLLLNNTVYIGWAAYCDQARYNGWLVGYNASTLEQTAVFNSTPDDATGECRGGIWQSGAAPAADSSGHLFLTTGNGGFNANTGGRSYGDSFLKLAAAAGGSVSVADSFTPSNQGALNGADLDVGAGGPLLLPDQPGAFPHLAVAAGKAGTIYLVNRDSLGGYHTNGDQVVQELAGAVSDGQHSFPMPAYFHQALYFAGVHDSVKAFKLANGLLSSTPVAKSANIFSYPGAGLSISSNASGGNAIVWALENSSQAVLHAYKASDLGELYNSNQAGGRDAPGLPVRFTLPTVMNGKVYVGTQSGLAVFGILPAAEKE